MEYWQLTGDLHRRTPKNVTQPVSYRGYLSGGMKTYKSISMKNKSENKVD